ncbi:unnamed protein product [Orchesella dallaii]|uniref:Gustatory receptor n=1 Tax=Orchesella dallaii TaxID=48710 RepID=A0ABP1QHR9_9HEXA
MALFMYFSALRHSFATLEENNPASYFKLFESLFSVMYKFTFMKTLWTKQHLILAWANYAHQSYWQRDECNQKIWRWLEKLPFLVALHLYFAFTCVLRLSKASTLSVSESYSNSTSTTMYSASHFFGAHWRKQIIESSKDLFDYLSIDDNSILEIVVAVFTGISICFRNLISMFSDVFILMSVLTLWRPVNDFAILMEIHDLTRVNKKIPKNGKPWPKIGIEKIFTSYAAAQIKGILDNYQALRVLSSFINQVGENVFMLYLAEAMFSYAFGFNEALLNDGILMGVSLTFYVSSFVIFVLSGDICRKVHVLKDWLYDNEEVLPLTSRQVCLTLDSISRDSVGISIGGTMTINFSRVATMSGIIITYFVIRMQSDRSAALTASDN